MAPKYAVTAFAALATLLLAATANAQSFPTRQITIYVGTSTGGPNDIIARVIADHLQRKYKQTAVVENRIGAGGALAFAAVARAPADGYSLAVNSAPTQSLFIKDTGFEVRDLLPVSIVSQSPYVLQVSRKSNLNTLAELIAYAKANPGRLTIGIVPRAPHETETIQMATALGINANLIGYKGSAPIYTAMLAGEVDAILGGSSAMVRNGQLVGLAVGTDRRVEDLPQLPTFREQGIPYNAVANFILWTRTGTPAEVVRVLAAESAELVKTTDFQNRVQKGFGMPAIGSTPEQAAAEARRELDGAKAAADRAGIKPE